MNDSPSPDGRLIFELTKEDSEAIMRHIKSGHYRFGWCHLSVHLDFVNDPNAKLWTGASGWLRVVEDKK